MSNNDRIVSVVDDEIYITKLFHEALRQNIDGISVFSFIDPVKAFEHFTENSDNYTIVISIHEALYFRFSTAITIFFRKYLRALTVFLSVVEKELF
jgi:hypothetical protein